MKRQQRRKAPRASYRPPPDPGQRPPYPAPPGSYGAPPQPGGWQPYGRPPTPPDEQPTIPPQGFGAPQGYGTPPYGYPPVAQSPSARRRRRVRRGLTLGPGCIFGCIGIVGVMMLTFLITAFVVYETYSNRLEGEIDKLANLAEHESFETTVLYDRDGNELYQVLGEGRRTKISLEQVPQHVIEATIAIEDDTFYQNRGVDLPSIARAGWQYVRHGYIVSGGSTITQQLIRNVLFTIEYRNEQSLNRKLDEALLAVILTQRMSKDEILEMYLNEIYYGNLAYGIEAAAQTYFNKSASELTLAEGALLAGLPQAPADLDPLNPDPSVQQRVIDRRRLVLTRMVAENYLTQAQADAAFAEPLVFASPDIRLDAAPHMVVYAQNELENLLVRELNLPGDEIKRMIARGGLQVYTTVDMDIQRLAENVARQQVARLAASNNMTNAAVVVLQPETGEILAMVGSINYDDESIDGQVNVTNAQRQPGSAMKPFTYAAALEKGWSPAQVIWDTETQIGVPGQPMYIPVNYDRSFHGPVRVREALANSYNVPAVQTLRQVGVEYLLWMMHRVGVTSLSSDPSRYGLSLTLGGGEVTPLELTTAYAVLANGGVYVPNTSIVCVTNSAREVLYEYEQGCPANARLTDRSKSVLANGRPVMDPRIAFIISDILADNSARSPAMGANSPLYTPGLPTSVKTGTTNDFKDNWTVGFTRNIAVGVWSGNTDNMPMNNISGLDGAAPIWNSVITGIYNTPGMLDNALDSRLPDEGHLRPPGGVSQRQLCSISRTALRDPASGCTPGYNEWLFDSPPAVPDANGSLVPSAPTPEPQRSANGPQPVEVEPGLYRVHVFPLPGDMANAYAASDTSGRTVPPRYCQVPIEVVGAIPGVQEQLFIAPPLNDDDAFRARMWAQANGVAVLPQFACNEQMLSAQPQAGGGGAAPPGVTAYIAQPAPGQTYSMGEPISITGTAAFQPGQASYYKLEIKGGGQFPDWTTIGDVGNWQNQSGVVDGELGQIMAGGVAPGSYELQLIVVGPDGNMLTTQRTFFNVAG